MTKQELINLVQAELTVSDTLKVNLEDKEIGRIIDVEKQWFYINCRDVIEDDMAVINPCCFYTTEYKKSRAIQLPECVWGIREFREIKDGNRLFGINDPNLNMEQVMNTDMWLSPFSSDAISARTINYSWFDLARSFSLLAINFHFNIATHRIHVLGRDPRCPVLLRALVGIPEEDLYNFYYFQRWCIAKSKCQLHRKLKTYSANIIGGVTITDSLWSEGTDEIKEIKDYINSVDTPDYLLMVQ